jgi:hypothetical protein
MIGNNNIPQTLEEMARRELESGESIAWMGMPKPRFFTKSTLGIFLFAIPWTAFSLFWVAGAAEFKIPDFASTDIIFPLFGLPFVLIGVSMLLTPITHYRHTLKTLYMITDRRVVIFEGGSSTTIRSYEAEKLGTITRKERNNGYGDLVFAKEFSQKNLINDIGFINIEDARNVEQKIKQMIQKVTTRKERMKLFEKEPLG